MIIKLASLEYAKNSYESNFDGFRFIAIPVFILFTLTGTVKPKDPGEVIIGKIVLTMIAAAVPALMIGASALSNLCGWSTDKILFTNKAHPSVKIGIRSFGCGAVDGTSPTIHVSKIKNVTPFFIHVSDIDTTTINKSEWIRVTD